MISQSTMDKNNSNSGLPADLQLVNIYQPLYSIRVMIAFTVAYVVIFLVGLCGNVLTCLVVLRRHYVHSQTPFYLNLAFSDLLLLAGLPADVYFFWYPYGLLGGGWFCVARAIVTESATNASILTIVIFTAERWISICHPAKTTTTFSNTTPATSTGGPLLSGKNKKFVLGIWLTAVTAASPLSAQLGLVHLIDRQSGTPIEDAAVCHIVPERELPYSFEASSLIFFVIPMILITMFYSSIIIQLRRTVARQSSVNDSPLMQVARRARQQAKASAAVIKILIAVVVAFFICFSPHHIQRLLATYISTKGDEFWATFSQFLFTISGLSYYCWTAVNPVIYCLLSKRFRFALQNSITCRRRRHKSTARQHLSNEMRFLNQRERRNLQMKVNKTCQPAVYGQGKTLRFPISCPIARKHGVQDSPGYQGRPEKMGLSSTCVSERGSPGQSRGSAGRKWQLNGNRKCPQSECYNVYYDGDKLVISFVNTQKRREGNSV